MLRRAVAAALAASALAGAGEARAWCRATTCDSEGSQCDPPEPTDCGTPLFWRRSCVGFAVQEDGSSQISRKAARSVLRRAFDAWEQADCGDGHPAIHVDDTSYVVCDRVEYNDTAGNANIVVFRDDEWTHANGPHNIALTTVTYDTDTGEIFDADIEVNTAQYTLTVTETTGDYDLVSVLTHEAGHFLGLAHSADVDATMFAIYNQGSTEERTLGADDVAAICATYTKRTLPDSCNPIPRHGFSTQCASAQTEGDCGVAPPSGGSPAPAPGLALLLLGAAAAGRRRLRSSPR